MDYREKHGEFFSALKSRVLILDGAMATELMRCGKKPASGCFDELNITGQQAVADVHRRYLEAGADIITTNTFNSNSISLPAYGLRQYVERMNIAGASAARSAADDFMTESGRSCWVAGSVGPIPIINKSHTADEVRDAYLTQISALIEGGVDMLLIETVLDTNSAKCALWAADTAAKSKGLNLPIMVSATLNERGNLIGGETLRDFVGAMSRWDVAAIGLNCGCGVRRMSEFVKELVSLTTLPIVFYPGLLDSEEPDITPIEELLSGGCLNIVGGCCGTSADYIRRLAALSEGFVPRRISDN